MLQSNFYLEIYFWYYFTVFPSRNPESLQSSPSWVVMVKFITCKASYYCIKLLEVLEKKNGCKDCLPSLKMSLPNMLKWQHCDNEREKKERERKKEKTDKTKYYISMIAFYCWRLVGHWCSCHILKSCAIYYWTDTWQNGIQRKMFSSCHEHGTKKRFWVSTKNDIHNVLVHHRIIMAQW